MSTYTYQRGIRLADRAPTSASIHLVWLGAGLAFGFLVPYVLADRLELPKDVYYGLYSAFAIGLFVAWALSTGQPLAAMIRRRWALATVLGVAFAGVTALIVLATDAGPRPDGLELAGAIVWRGLVYGFADGVLLSAFPILLVFAAFASTRMRERLLGKIAIGLAALAASVAMTAAYHLGYSDFRSEKVQKPITGGLVWSVPTLATLNPIGAPIAHAGMHVTAVLHDYETDLFLPPHEYRQVSREEVNRVVTTEEYKLAEREMTLRDWKRGWKIHAVIYGVVSTGLIVANVLVNAFTDAWFYWFPFPLVGWGIGLAMHYLHGVRWAEREVRARQASIERRAETKRQAA